MPEIKREFKIIYSCPHCAETLMVEAFSFFEQYQINSDEQCTKCNKKINLEFSVKKA